MDTDIRSNVRKLQQQLRDAAMVHLEPLTETMQAIVDNPMRTKRKKREAQKVLDRIAQVRARSTAGAAICHGGNSAESRAANGTERRGSPSPTGDNGSVGTDAVGGRLHAAPSCGGDFPICPEPSAGLETQNGGER